MRAELDKVEEEYLELVHRMILSLDRSAGGPAGAGDWDAFVAATYGSLADAPIERGEQGDYEDRNPLR